MTLTYLFRIFVRKECIMETKLTLRLSKSVIERAKKLARNQNISLSKMIELYLDSITKPKTDNAEVSPLVESLIGVFQTENDFDFKKNYSKYLEEKYL